MNDERGAALKTTQEVLSVVYHLCSNYNVPPFHPRQRFAHFLSFSANACSTRPVRRLTLANDNAITSLRVMRIEVKLE